MTKKRIMGGVILQTEDLVKELEKEVTIPGEETIGLVFRCPKGKCRNVDIEIIRVWEDEEGKLKGEKVDDMKKTGASYKSNKPIRHEELDFFKFQYKKISVKKKFDFSFFGKEELKLLLKDCGKEVFISGTTVSFGKVSKIRGKHFSLMIEHGPENKSDDSQDSIPLGQYTFSVGIPCPPTWCRDKNQKEKWDLIIESVMNA